MMRLLIVILFLLMILPAHPAAGADEDIKQKIIRDSIASYPGRCPCPYNTDRAGRECGKRSAWSKPGGRAPLCYPDDISDEMVKRYKGRG